MSNHETLVERRGLYPNTSLPIPKLDAVHVTRIPPGLILGLCPQGPIQTVPKDVVGLLIRTTSIEGIDSVIAQLKEKGFIPLC